MDLNQSLYNLRLAARIHGLLTAAMPGLTKSLLKLIAAQTTLFKRPKQVHLEAMGHELPILVLILTLQEMDQGKVRLPELDTEFLKACLVHFFAVHFNNLYLQHKDPITETFARVDWYLDGGEGAPAELFGRYIAGAFPDLKEDLADSLKKFIDELVLPEIYHALDLAPKYRF